MKKHILLIGILVVTLFSCGKYEKILKSSDYKMKYQKAFEYYNAEEYVRAATIFEQIVPVFKGTDKSDTVSYYHAMSYYKQKDYTLAGHYLKNFFQNYPYSPFADEAQFLSAYCFYMDSPRPSLDQENTYTAIDAFTLYIRNHPTSKHIEDAQKYIGDLQDKLVDKSYKNARLYFDLGDYKSSIIALNNSISEYPNTKYREELQFLILQSNYFLAKNSVLSKQKERFQSTIDEYYSFIAEFPNSKYSKDAKDIYEDSQSFIK
ncbi:MAG: outer membrane protein assembly factor BamD [Bacteroidales bacterium]|nr:outer membrane protein assembly factor BamD [Bacteroidales bacterium]